MVGMLKQGLLTNEKHEFNNAIHPAPNIGFNILSSEVYCELGCVIPC